MANEPQKNGKNDPAVNKEELPGLSHISAADEGNLPAGRSRESQPDKQSEIDLQDNYVETKEPSELMFCVILSSIYAGLARYCWSPLEESGLWNVFVNIEGFFITISLLSLLLGLRPYLSPSSLQISKHGLKYRGPYWPQRRTVNWSQVVHMYVSPELMLIIYRLPNKPKSIRPLLVHSVYLADREKIADSVVRFSPVEPTFVANPGILTRTAQILLFAAIVIWIANVLKG
jgi:hypothetical protein